MVVCNVKNIFHCFKIREAHYAVGLGVLGVCLAVDEKKIDVGLYSLEGDVVHNVVAVDLAFAIHDVVSQR